MKLNNHKSILSYDREYIIKITPPPLPLGVGEGNVGPYPKNVFKKG